MNYTFYRRRELNKRLKRQFPDIPWEENTKWNPRMNTRTLPDGCKLLMSIEHLEELAYEYHKEHGTPMPIYIYLPPICRDAQDEYDVNYVDITRAASLEEAAMLVGMRRVYALPGR